MEGRIIDIRRNTRGGDEAPAASDVHRPGATGVPQRPTAPSTPAASDVHRPGATGVPQRPTAPSIVSGPVVDRLLAGSAVARRRAPARPVLLPAVLARLLRRGRRARLRLVGPVAVSRGAAVASAPTHTVTRPRAETPG